MWKTTTQESEILIMTTTKTNSITISKKTLDILKNFSAINSGITVNEGNVLNTVESGKSIVAEARVSETFPKKFSIYELNKFLGTVSLFKDPEFVFEDNYILIKSGKASVKYWYCDPTLVVSTNKRINMPKAVVKFDLDGKEFAEVLKAASVLQVMHMIVRSSEDGSRIELAVSDKSDRTSNSFCVDVGENTSGAKFEFIFDVDNLKMIPGDYTVEISEKVVSCFSNKNEPITYWIALNADSTYEA